MPKTKLILIVGPTATGKSDLAVELSTLFNGEIVSADSMQIYRYMDIGTAKPTREQRANAAHHLIDIVNPDEDYTAARYKKDASAKIEEISSRGKNIFVAGGTGLYVKALTQGLFEGPASDASIRQNLMEEAKTKGKEYIYEKLKEVDPISASTIHPNNLIRVIRALEVYNISGKTMSDFQREHGFSEEPFETLKIGLIKERDSLYRDIERRVDRMMEEGLLEETRRLLGMGYSSCLKPMCALGYKEMCNFIAGEYNLEKAVEELKKNTRHYAKRQITWFKKDNEIRWFHPDGKKDIINLVKEFLS
ncbi:MAG: tRNA (adenosine(37)-N6)-dimethylallyltransferase MiaA [Deltaproteobacteria bacterium]|nr:tRNA (adenosine(37)-N6)-dimethylallyltransferase MiaA [Deltaproteobacteria bacterium]